MSEKLSAKYYQENKKIVQKIILKHTKIFSKKKKEKKATIWL